MLLIGIFIKVKKFVSKMDIIDLLNVNLYYKKWLSNYVSCVTAKNVSDKDMYEQSCLHWKNAYNSLVGKINKTSNKTNI